MAAQDITFGKPDLTEKEISLLIAAIKHNSAELKVDWNAVALEIGYEEGHTAHDMFNKLKIKIVAEIGMPISTSAVSRSAIKSASTSDFTPLGRHNNKIKKIKEEIVEDQDDDLDDDDIAPAF